MILSIHHTYLLPLYNRMAHTQSHSRPGKCSFMGRNCECIPDSRVSYQCGSGGGLLLMAWQVKAPESAAIRLNEKARTGALHKQLISESANY